MVAVLDLFPLSSEKMPTSRYLFLLPLLASILSLTESTCSRGCELALASYYVSPNTTLSHVSSIFGNASYGDILQYNHGIIDGGSILTGSRINISFPCDCINGDFLGRTFSYLTVGEENYDRIAGYDYANLSNSDVLSLLNRYPPTGMPSGSKVNVAVTCFCGDESVSKDYGLFVTYPLRGEDSLRSLAAGYGFWGKRTCCKGTILARILAQGKGLCLSPLKIYLEAINPLTSREGGSHKREKAAIKKMDMEASREFCAELKVLTHVHHSNLVSDFGLAKLAEVRSTSLQTRLVGTFGYMPPEYAKYGDVSPKVDVYAFGVVLYELISAKEAIIKTNGSSNDTKKPGALKHQDPRDELRTLVDVRLGDSYPIESIIKMAQLARACTHENPQLRPSMRSIMVALMTLSSSSEELDMGSLYDNEALENFISGS
ncbi:hypothetical protein HPP92_002683 [Vanilla planifolia]|uniref:Protein kinase domain-containing protein n=1 Tax=Vanilla planifolia TaxID=51239 RepID=A0A835S284_VANPL|nr:hypothetical protein HPP92_002683 [Vanilla planifolia]